MAGLSITSGPGSRCGVGACVRCTLAYLHSGPNTWLFTNRIVSSSIFPETTSPAVCSCYLCLINSVAPPVSPQLILLRAKNSGYKCTLYKHVMYTNYANLQSCRWSSVDCSSRIRSGRLKFERGSHVTLITAQPQPNIPLSLVIHLCSLSLTDKTMQNSGLLKTCTSNKETLSIVLIGHSPVKLNLSVYRDNRHHKSSKMAMTSRERGGK